MELLLALLFVTTFASTGVLALWATTSRMHWFLRAGTFLGVLSLLLLIPAHEALCVILVQGVTVVTAINAQRWLHRRRTKLDLQNAAARQRSPLRFSLLDSLLALTLCAFAVAIGRSIYLTPDIEWTGPQTEPVAGVGFGLLTLFSAWRVDVTWRLGHRLVAALAVLPATAAVLHYVEPEIVTIVLSFSEGAEMFGTQTWSVAAWGGVAFATVATTMAMLTALGYLRRRQAVEPNAYGWKVRPFGAAAVILVAAFPAYIYYRMITPTPIPRVQLPQPNGIDDLAIAGERLDVRAISYYYETPVEELAAEIRGLSEAFAIVERGLSRGCVVPVDYLTTDLNMDLIMGSRTIGRALAARARVAVAEGRHGDAVEDYATTLRLGQVISRGVLVHWLVGIAIQGVACQEAWDHREALEAAHCRRLIAELQRAADAAGELDEVLNRERAWSMHAIGPYGRLGVILSDLDGGGWIPHVTRDQTLPRHLAQLRLFMCVLAIRAFEYERGRRPKSLSELAPDYLSAVPIDPFDPSGAEIRYKPVGVDYLLYSVGLNQIDEGGAAPNEDDSPGLPKTGDFRLDLRYAPEPAS